MKRYVLGLVALSALIISACGDEKSKDEASGGDEISPCECAQYTSDIRHGAVEETTAMNKKCNALHDKLGKDAESTFAECEVTLPQLSCSGSSFTIAYMEDSAVVVKTIEKPFFKSNINNSFGDISVSDVDLSDIDYSSDYPDGAVIIRFGFELDKIPGKVKLDNMNTISLNIGKNRKKLCKLDGDDYGSMDISTYTNSEICGSLEIIGCDSTTYGGEFAAHILKW